MTAPESKSVVETAEDLKRSNEFFESDFSPNKKLKTEEELKTQGTSTEATSSNGSSRKGSFALEADAAEDKGLRHTMEDAWVVLPDATLESPGRLRFLLNHYFHLDGF